ncbi:hypothetical protein L6R52_40145 [Myxococcota bacterium]|nr:hypothetical protein [Myxococcota bacterium]
MDPQLLLIAGSAGLIAGAVAIARWRTRRTDEARADLATRLGLTYTPRTLFRPSQLAGTLDGLPVAVRWSTQVIASGVTTATNDRTTYELQGLPRSLSVKRAGLATGLKRLVGGVSHGVDDEAFDRAVELQGDELDRAVFLVEAVRLRALGAIELGARIEGGDLTYFVERKDSPELVEERLTGFAALGAALVRTREDLPRVLAGLVDRCERAARALDVLVTHFPEAPETMEACARTRASSDARLRMLSAIGRDDFAALRTIVASPDAPMAVRTGALEALLGSTAREASLDADLEPALVELLASPSTLAQRAAAEGLGLCGTLTAVEALLTRTKGLLTDGEVKARAQSAVKAIQRRTSGAGAGHLSLSASSGDGGALSFAGGGELAVARREGEPASDGDEREPRG